MTWENDVKLLKSYESAMVNWTQTERWGGEDSSIQKVGGHLLYCTKISKSQGYTCTLMQPDQNFGEKVKIERSCQVLCRKTKLKLKIKMTSLTHSLSTILRLGITQGTYNIRRCLFACMTAALSADILSIDAQPYCLAFGMSISSVDSVLSTNTKRIINTKIRKWKRTVQVLVLQ